jgi:hypothetical protein
VSKNNSRIPEESDLPGTGKTAFELKLHLSREQIESQGWEFYQTNKMISWYKKFSPEIGGNWYRYPMYWTHLLHDPEMEWLKIQVDFSGGVAQEECDTVFEGHCKDINDFRAILKMVRML